MSQILYCKKCNELYPGEEKHKCTGNKYRAVKALIEGITFDSKREAGRYCELKMLERAGKIAQLEYQVIYEITINGKHIANYIADFRYINDDGHTVVEDVKSLPTKTATYRLKKKIVEALHEIKIIEVE